MITDTRIRDHLIQTGRLGDADLDYAIVDMLTRQRHLDTPPKPLRLVSVAERQQCGLAAEFNYMFNTVYGSGESDTGTIRIGGRDRLCDYSVYVTMKTLMLVGTHKDEKRADTCRDLFFAIISIEDSYITARDVFLNVLRPNGDYYHDTLCKAIIQSAYTTKETLLYTVMQQCVSKPDYDEFSRKVIEHFKPETMEDLNELFDKYHKHYKKHGMSKAEKTLEYLYNTSEEEW